MSPSGQYVLSGEQQLEVCRLYRSGQSTMALGIMFRVNNGTISRVLRRHGVPIRPKGEQSAIPWEIQQEVIRLYTEEWLNYVQISKLVHVGYATIPTILKKNGITLRHPRDARRPSPKVIEEAVYLYQIGMSTAELGKHFKIAPSTAGRWVGEFGGQPLRTWSEALRLSSAPVGPLGQKGQELNDCIREILLRNPDGLYIKDLIEATGWKEAKVRHRVNIMRNEGLVRRGGERRVHGYKLFIGAEAEVRRGKPTDEETLPIEPFRNWLMEEIEIEQARERAMSVVSITRDKLPTTLVANRLGVSDRIMRRIINREQENVSLDFVDRALVGAGGSTRLEDLYPYDGDLFSEPNPQPQLEAAA